MPRQARRSAVALAMTVCAPIAPVAAFGASAHDEQGAALAPARHDAGVRLGPQSAGGRDIARHFVGVSVEWTLTDRYMGSNSRLGFANCCGTSARACCESVELPGPGSVRRVSGRQRPVRHAPRPGEDPRDVEPCELDAAESGWVTVLGTAMAPSTPAFPWRTVDQPSVRPGRGCAGLRRRCGPPGRRRHRARKRAGPDLLGRPGPLSQRIPAYAGADPINQWPRVVPASSENIGTLAEHQGPHDQHPMVLGLARDPRHRRPRRSRTNRGARALRDRPLLPVGAHLPDRPVPLPDDRAPPVPGTHGQLRLPGLPARDRGGPSRPALSDGRDEHRRRARAPGVSDVAASATWTLDTMFNAACPQPPDQPGAERRLPCGRHRRERPNAEVRAYFFPEEGNAYYNAIGYDPTPAVGPPTPGRRTTRCCCLRDSPGQPACVRSRWT